MQFWFAAPGVHTRVDVMIVENVIIPLYPEGQVACATPVAIFFVDHDGDGRFIQSVIEECKKQHVETKDCSFFKVNPLPHESLADLLSQDPQQVPEGNQALVCLDHRLMLKERFLNENRQALAASVREIYFDRGINENVPDGEIEIGELEMDQRHMEARYPAYF